MSPDSWTVSILLNSSDMGSSAFQNDEARSRTSFFLAELARSALKVLHSFEQKLSSSKNGPFNLVYLICFIKFLGRLQRDSNTDRSNRR